MSKLTVMQIYAMIRGLEASIARYEAEGSVVALRRSRKKLAEYQAELNGRIKALVDSGEPMPEHFTQVGAPAGFAGGPHPDGVVASQSPMNHEEQMAAQVVLAYVIGMFTAAGEETFSRLDILLTLNFVRTDPELFDPEVVIEHELLLDDEVRKAMGWGGRMKAESSVRAKLAELEGKRAQVAAELMKQGQTLAVKQAEWTAAIRIEGQIDGLKWVLTQVGPED